MKGGDREWPVMQSGEWPGWNQDSCFWKSFLASLLHPGQWKEFLWDDRAQINAQSQCCCQGLLQVPSTLSINNARRKARREVHWVKPALG